MDEILELCHTKTLTKETLIAMLNNKSKNYDDREIILNDTIKVIKEIHPGWQMQFEESIRPETFLGADLAMKSLDFVRLVSDIQQRYSHKLIPFQELFMAEDGNFLQDIQISHLVDFLYKHLNNE